MRTIYIKLFEEFSQSSQSKSTCQSVWETLTKKGTLPKQGKSLILIGNEQKLYLLENGKIIDTITVSTSAKGFGTSGESGQTPTGLFKTGNSIIGKLYEVIISKKPTGTILGKNTPSTRVDKDGKKHTAEVLTGLIELYGEETHNKNTFSRSIYIHGTNRESNLGKPASGGCIRVANDKIIELSGKIPSGTPLYIQA